VNKQFEWKDLSVDTLENECLNLRSILFKLIKVYNIKEKAVLMQIEEVVQHGHSLCIYCGKHQPRRYDYCGFCGCKIRKILN